jgi:hypothetical protein
VQSDEIRLPPPVIIFGYALFRAMVVVEARPFDFRHGESATMIVTSIIFSVFGIGFLCWLMFTLAAYALPFFAAMTVGLNAYHSGAGVIGAFLVGLAAGAVTLIAAQFVFAVVRSPVLRAAIVILFVAPAAIAGFHAALALAQLGVPSTSWREAFAVVGAMFVGGTALVRIAAIAPPTEIGARRRGPAQPRMADAAKRR